MGLVSCFSLAALWHQVSLEWRLLPTAYLHMFNSHQAPGKTPFE